MKEIFKNQIEENKIVDEEMLSKMGYNPEFDIYPQFMKRWSLNVSKSPRKGSPNHWTYKDCQE
jgi:hypothetical protein